MVRKVAKLELQHRQTGLKAVTTDLKIAPHTSKLHDKITISSPHFCFLSSLFVFSPHKTQNCPMPPCSFSASQTYTLHDRFASFCVTE
ncbi:hypothetical protein JHK82_050199 [Glycine max]|nr:hypothetical protein JHK82_050199 [Glycine max]